MKINNMKSSINFKIEMNYTISELIVVSLLNTFSLISMTNECCLLIFIIKP